MIFDDYRNGIRNRLIQDSAYFTRARAIDVLAERRRTIRKATQDAVASRGIALVVGMPSWRQDLSEVDNEFVFESHVEAYENPKMVEEEDDGRDGYACIVQAGALLGNHALHISVDDVEVNPFSAFRILFGGHAGERDGQEIYRLTLQSRIYIDNIASVLGDQAGAWLVDENGNPLIVTP